MSRELQQLVNKLQAQHSLTERRRSVHELRSRLQMEHNLLLLLDTSSINVIDAGEPSAANSATWANIAALAIKTLIDDLAKVTASASSAAAAADAAAAAAAAAQIPATAATTSTPLLATTVLRRQTLTLADDTEALLQLADRRKTAHNQYPFMLQPLFDEKSAHDLDAIKALASAVLSANNPEVAGLLIRLLYRRFLTIPEYARLFKAEHGVKLVRAALRHLRQPAALHHSPALAAGGKDFARFLRWYLVDSPQLMQERLLHSADSMQLHDYFRYLLDALHQRLRDRDGSVNHSVRPTHTFSQNDSDDESISDIEQEPRPGRKTLQRPAAASITSRRKARLAAPTAADHSVSDKESPSSQPVEDAGGDTTRTAQSWRQRRFRAAAQEPVAGSAPLETEQPDPGLATDVNVGETLAAAASHHLPPVETMEMLLQALAAYWRFLATAAPNLLLKTGREVQAQLMSLLRHGGVSVGYAVIHLLRIYTTAGRAMQPLSPHMALALLDPQLFAVLRAMLERSLASLKDFSVSDDDFATLNLLVDAAVSAGHVELSGDTRSPARPPSSLPTLSELFQGYYETQQYSAHCSWLLPLALLLLRRQRWQPLICGSAAALVQMWLRALQDPAVHLLAVLCFEALLSVLPAAEVQQIPEEVWRQVLQSLPLRNLPAHNSWRWAVYHTWLLVHGCLQQPPPANAALAMILHVQYVSAVDVAFAGCLMTMSSFSFSADQHGEFLAWLFAAAKRGTTDSAAFAAMSAATLAISVSLETASILKDLPASDELLLLRSGQAAERQLQHLQSALQFDRLIGAWPAMLAIPDTDSTLTQMLYSCLLSWLSAGNQLRADDRLQRLARSLCLALRPESNLAMVTAGDFAASTNSTFSPIRLHVDSFQTLVGLQLLILVPELENMRISLAGGTERWLPREIGHVWQRVNEQLAVISAEDCVSSELHRVLSLLARLFAPVSRTLPAQYRTMSYDATWWDTAQECGGCALGQVDAREQELWQGLLRRHDQFVQHLHLLTQQVLRLFLRAVQLEDRPSGGTSEMTDLDEFDTPTVSESGRGEAAAGAAANANTTAMTEQRCMSPRHMTEQTQALLLDLVHSARTLQQLQQKINTGAQSSTLNLALIDDAQLLSQVLADPQAPLYIALNTARSLMLCPSHTDSLKAESARLLITLVCDADFAGCLKSDPAFMADAVLFCTTLQILSQAVRHFVALDSGAASRENNAALAMLRAFLAELLAVYSREVAGGQVELSRPGCGLSWPCRIALGDLLLRLAGHSPATNWLTTSSDNHHSPTSWYRLCQYVSLQCRDRNLLCRLHSVHKVPQLLASLRCPRAAEILLALLDQSHRSVLTPFQTEVEDHVDVELNRLSGAPLRFEHELLQHLRVALLLFSRLVVAAPEANKWCLFLLLREARGPMTFLVEALLDHVAAALQYRGRFSLVTESLSAILCHFLQQTALYSTSHPDIMLRTPFHALPVWLLDESYQSSPLAAARHVFVYKDTVENTVASAYDSASRASLRAFFNDYQETLVCSIFAAAPISDAKALLSAFLQAAELPLSCILEHAAAIHAVLFSVSAERRHLIKQQVVWPLLGDVDAEAFWKNPRRHQLQIIIQRLLLHAQPGANPQSWDMQRFRSILNSVQPAAPPSSIFAADPEPRSVEASAPPIALTEALARLNEQVTAIGRRSSISHVSQFLHFNPTSTAMMLHELSLRMDRQTQPAAAVHVFQQLAFVLEQAINPDGALFNSTNNFQYPASVQELAIVVGQRALRRWPAVLQEEVCAYFLQLYRSSPNAEVLLDCAPELVLQIESQLATGTKSSPPPHHYCQAFGKQHLQQGTTLSTELLSLLLALPLPPSWRDSWSRLVPDTNWADLTLLSVLDPVPEGSAKLNELRQQRQRQRQSWTLQVECETWIGVGKACSGVPRATGIAALAERLQSAPEEQLAALSSTTVAALIETLQEAYTSSSVHTRDAAATSLTMCLGILARYKSTINSDLAPESSPTSFARPRRQPQALPASFDLAHPRSLLLQLLSQIVHAFLSDEVSEAQAALVAGRAVLACSQLRSEAEDLLFNQLMAPGLVSEAGSQGGSQPSSAASLPNLAELKPGWAEPSDADNPLAILAQLPQEPAAVGSWLCRMAATLVHKALDAADEQWRLALQCMLPLLVTSSMTCRRVLPYLTLALLNWDPEQQNRRMLSAFLDQTLRTCVHVMSKSAAAGDGCFSNFAATPKQTSEACRQVAKLLLDLMRFFRRTPYEPSASRGDLRGAKAMHSRANYAGAASAQGRRAAASGRSSRGHHDIYKDSVLVNPPQTHWDSWRWLSVDWLQAAQAAEACQEDYTAIFLAEAWIEMQTQHSSYECATEAGDGLGFGSSRVSRVRDAGPLLARALTAIGEPDSPYAFVDPLNAEVRIQLYQQEGAWAHGLSAYDLMYHHMAAGHDEAAGGGGGRDGGVGVGVSGGHIHGVTTSHHKTPAGHLSDNFEKLSATTVGLAGALQGIGLNAIAGLAIGGAQAVLGSAATQTPSHAAAWRQVENQLRDLQFEAAWRQRQWDSPKEEAHGRLGVMVEPHSGMAVVQMKGLGAFHESLHQTFVAFHQNDRVTSKMVLQHLQNSTATEFADLPLEGTARLQRLMHKMNMLEEVRHAVTNPATLFAGSLSAAVDSSAADANALMELLHVRRVLLEIASQTYVRNAAELAAARRQRIALERSLLDLARERQQYHQALVGAQRLELLWRGQGDPEAMEQRLMEDARTLWCRQEQRLAVTMMERLLSDRSQPGSIVTAKMNILLAEWQSQLRSAAPAAILNNLLKPAKNCILDASQADASLVPELCLVYGAMARFAGDNYVQLQAKLNSPEHLQLVAMLHANEEEEIYLGQMMKVNESDPTLRRRRRILRSRNEQDRAAILALTDDCKRFLRLAIRNLLHCLKLGEDAADNDDFVFRLCSYWFQNAADEHVAKLMAAGWSAVSSSIFLPLIYQLAARIEPTTSSPAAADSSFQATLQEIVLTVARDHPHQALFVLLALENGSGQAPRSEPAAPPLEDGNAGDRPAKRANMGSGALHTSSVSGATKAACVTALLDRLGQGSAHLRQLLLQSRLLCRAYIELAEMDIAAHKANLSVFRNRFRLANLRVDEVDRVAVLTKPQPLGGAKTNGSAGPSALSGLVYIQGFDAEFETVGGVNLPRVIHCLGSDGVRYKQLVKGKDDSRQDAVIQQVFGHVNLWLSRDSTSRARSLQMQTYKVVPLSEQTGVLEWKTRTVPLGQWLLRGPTSAHARYNPVGSWAHELCRHKIDEAGRAELGAGETRLQKLSAIFREVCQHFPPVMRRFFTEHYPEPRTWFERRLAYSRSLAVCSMVGYIIGLGDRHPNNILLQLDTAELVHIDLGVTFEQGKLLPTPERVPFRLTRDLIDGLGAAGVEGVFRRCSELTLTVLRRAQLPLLTILEVFLHDPLHAWRLSPDKAARLQELKEVAGMDSVMPGPAAAGEHLSGRTSRAGAATPVNLLRRTSAVTAGVAGHGAAGAGGTAGEPRTGPKSAARQADHGGRITPASLGGGGDGIAAAGRLTSEESEARRILSRLQTKLQGFDEGAQLSVPGQVNLLIQLATSPDNLCQMFAGWQAWA